MEEFIAEVDPLILALAGIILPLIIAVINSVRWSSQIKALISAFVSLGTGAALGWLMGMDDTRAILVSAVGTYAWVQVTYLGLLKPSGLTQTIETQVSPRG